MQSEFFVEAIQLTPCVCLQAAESKFRLNRVAPWDPAPPIESFLEPGNENVTRQLMAGAFYAGFPPPPTAGDSKRRAAEPSLLRHIYSLAASYQTTHVTPPIMRRVAERLAAAGKAAAAAHCLKVAREESGHDTLALMDLAALGLPAEAFVERVRPQDSLELAGFFNRLAESEHPIATLGYAYALERMALFNTADSIAAIEALMPAGVNATRCLRVHSVVGSDAEHVAESISFIATLSPIDRAAIARATYDTIALQNIYRQDRYPGDDAMRSILDEFGWSLLNCA